MMHLENVLLYAAIVWIVALICKYSRRACRTRLVRERIGAHRARSARRAVCAWGRGDHRPLQRARAAGRQTWRAAARTLPIRQPARRRTLVVVALRKSTCSAVDATTRPRDTTSRGSSDVVLIRLMEVGSRCLQLKAAGRAAKGPCAARSSWSARPTPPSALYCLPPGTRPTLSRRGQSSDRC
jgi:hypothetical protein